VAAVGILLIGIGAYLMYDAFKNEAPAPVTNAKTALTTVSS
jgi:putative Mn2+ efflux pump MntP